MQNYSNYHRYDPLERRLRNGKDIFKTSKRGINSYKGVVDKKIETDIIIERSYNPYNEKKEERIFKCDLTVDIMLGSTLHIEETNQTFIVVTDINTNRIFKFFKGVELNYTLNWVNPDGELVNSLCYLYDKDIYSIGVKEIKFIPTLHEELFLTLQKDENTKSIKRGSRFIIDGYAWEVTNIGAPLGKLMKLSVKEVVSERDDNIKDEIPNEGNINRYSIEVLNGDNISVSIGKTFKLTTVVKKNDEVLDNAILVYSSLDPLVASIDGDGVIHAISEGSTTITIAYNDIKTSVDVNIEALEIITYKAIIEGEDSIRTGRKATYMNKPTANGEVIDLVSVWYITDLNDEPTSLATFEANGDTCIVTATRKADVGFIRLHVKCIVEVEDEIDGTMTNEIIRDYKEVEIKGLFAP